MNTSSEDKCEYVKKKNKQTILSDSEQEREEE